MPTATYLEVFFSDFLFPTSEILKYEDWDEGNYYILQPKHNSSY